MLSQSVEEYNEISTLIRGASDAVLRYSTAGIAFSGSAGLLLVRGLDEHASDLGAAAAVMSILLLTSMFHVLINYKCDSHNRLVAYRSLIACENIEAFGERKPYLSDNDQLTAFSFCIGYVNSIYKSKRFNVRLFSGFQIDNMSRGIFYGTHSADRERYAASGFPLDVRAYGFSEGRCEKAISKSEPMERWPIDMRIYVVMYITVMLRRTSLLSGIELKKKDRESYQLAAGGTWPFPVYVARFFTVLLGLEFGLFLIYGYQAYNSGEAHWHHGLNLAFVCLIVILFVAFAASRRKSMMMLVEMMAGHRMIDAYFRQFLPFRLMYVSQITGGRRPSYLGLRLKEDDENRGKVPGKGKKICGLCDVCGYCATCKVDQINASCACRA